MFLERCLTKNGKSFMGNKRLTVLIVLLGLGSFSNFLLTQEFPSNMKRFKFSLSCKVLDQTITTIEDGKSKKFGFYKDGLMTGDSFTITWEYWVNYPVVIDKDGHAEGERLYIDYSPNFDYLNGQFNRNREDVQVFTSLARDKYVIKKSYIRLVRDMATGVRTLILSRYYKNDWQLSFSRHSYNGEKWILNGNCMNMPKDFNEMIELWAEEFPLNKNE